MSYRPPEPLGPSHQLDAFVCDSVEQTEWLERIATVTEQPVEWVVPAGTGVNGHLVLPSGGHEISPVVDSGSPHR